MRPGSFRTVLMQSKRDAKAGTRRQTSPAPKRKHQSWYYVEESALVGAFRKRYTAPVPLFVILTAGL